MNNEPNIDILLDRLNYEKIIFENEQKVILVPKNPAATAVAEVTENKDDGSDYCDGNKQLQK